VTLRDYAVPLKLIAPALGRWANYRIRGTYLGFYVDRTTGTTVKAVAAELKQLREGIERGRVAIIGEPTFASAAIAYLDAGGEERFVAKLNDWFGDKPLRRSGFTRALVRQQGTGRFIRQCRRS
jgi:hypothetical protein